MTFTSIASARSYGMLLCLFSLTSFSFGQKPSHSENLEVLKGEKWWSGTVWDGHIMPLQDSYSINLYGNNKGNQAQPLLLSNHGRVIWSESPIAFELKDNVLHIESYGSPIIFSEAGNTLREAYLYASNTYFPASDKQPDQLLFEKPQYNTWIELIYNQNQQDILSYARSIIENGMPPGVLMIDDNWQEDYGKWNFHAGRFSSPKLMMDSLHQMGFKVMLWICPFVSPDSDVYRELASKDYFIRTEQGDLPLIVRWWNGASAVLDFTNPSAVEWFEKELNRLQQKYGVDGFKLDAGDTYFYNQPLTAYDTSATPNDHTYSFQQFGLKYPLNEYRATWKMGGQPLAQRLHDKGHNWNDLQKLIPQIGLQGLLGYPFNCPDMIGGGEYGSFINLTSVDQDLIVRSAQIHALMPMMQFSVAPWRVLDKEHFEAIKKAIQLREKYLPTILSLLEDAKTTGEPIVRLMEYVFPNQNFSDVNDQFMLGNDILVAPILQKDAQERTIKLPKGNWFYKGKKYTGGQIITLSNLQLNDLPVFTRNK